MERLYSKPQLRAGVLFGSFMRYSKLLLATQVTLPYESSEIFHSSVFRGRPNKLSGTWMSTGPRQGLPP